LARRRAQRPLPLRQRPQGKTLLLEQTAIKKSK
jgi:hypothetical protein